VAAVILLDTHVVVWLYTDPKAYIPAAVARRLNSEQLGLPPFVRLELTYLHEIGRIAVSGQEILDELCPKLEIALTDPPAALVCQVANQFSWTRDPFDRLIAAQAIATATPLLTKDLTIRKNLDLAWWGD
jgi:PIN domain nuclease of toxin-antitoxin system